MNSQLNDYDGWKLESPPHEEDPDPIICDLCKEPISGTAYPVYNGNHRIQKGLNQCGKCLISE